MTLRGWIFVVGIVVLGGTNSWSEDTTADGAEPADRVYQFFKMVGYGQVEQAFDSLLDRSVLLEDPLIIVQLRDRLNQLQQRLGKLTGYVVVDTQRVASTLYQLRCLSLHPKRPIRWRFVFYRSPTHGWILLRLDFDQSVQPFFRRQ